MANTGSSTQGVPLSEGQAKELFVDWSKYDGQRVTSSSGGGIYLIMNGHLHHIPDPTTYNNLFTTWQGVQTNDYLMDNVPPGAPLSVGALIAQGNLSAPQYLVTNNVKMWIPSPAVVTQFSFKAATTYPQILIDYIQQGDNVG